MTYRYNYTGSEDVTLPTVGISAKGNDSSVIYESQEQINHPLFVLIDELMSSDNPEQEVSYQDPMPSDAPETPVEPSQEEEKTQDENVSQEENASIE